LSHLEDRQFALAENRKKEKGNRNKEIGIRKEI